MNGTTENNPLLSIAFEIPFPRIQAAHVAPAIRELIQRSQKAIDQLGEDTGPRTYANTMLALENSTEVLDWAIGVVRHLEATATTPELRAAYNEIQPEVSEFYSGIPLHPGLWRVLREFAATPEAQALTGARRRFVSKTIENFRRNGADLDDEGKKKLGAIDVELSVVTTKYSENVLDSTNAWELVITDESRLAGLPPTAVAAARQSAASKGQEGWRFTLQQPSYVAVMTYLEDRQIREQVYRAYATRATVAPQDNRELLPKILSLRRAKAELLGVKDFADFVLFDRMAHTGERAEVFLLDLKAKTERHFERENAELLAFCRANGFGAGETLQPWDIGYWAEKQRQALYDFDEEVLRPYFALEKVVQGLFATVKKLFAIDVVPQEGVPGWDVAVRYFRILDETGTFLGALYTDWYPRENKRGGAWMDAFLTGGPANGEFHPHLGLMCGNLTPPVDGKPALLTHRDVETIFHEFGHLLHHCLSRVEVRSLSGTNVPWDFVELPSQIMENWCWEREALDVFARHYETGAAIPEDLFLKMRRAKTYRSANAQMRQLSFGLTDLALHRHYDAARDGDIVAYSREILQQFTAAPLPPEHAMIASFTHLFSSPVAYAAGYYSYKWAEVLDADAFTRFRDNGIFNQKVGLEFRDRILARGDSDDPAELYRGFMGRDPDPNALLARSGLV